MKSRCIWRYGCLSVGLLLAGCWTETPLHPETARHEIDVRSGVCDGDRLTIVTKAGTELTYFYACKVTDDYVEACPTPALNPKPVLRVRFADMVSIVRSRNSSRCVRLG